MLEWLQLVVCAVALCLFAGAVLVVAFLSAVHVVRLPSWKHLKNVPGPNEDVPLRWVISQHLKAERLKSMMPYNVSTLEIRIALSKLFHDHGLCRFYLGTLPSVLIFRADHMETVLANTMTKAPSYDFLRSWLGTGLLTSTGPKWKKRRKMLTPAFHFRILEDYTRPINEHSRNMVAKICQLRQKSEWIDVVPLAKSCTLDMFLETIMGVTASQEQEECKLYVDAVHNIANDFILRTEKPWLFPEFTFNLTEHGRRFKKNIAAVLAFSDKIIKKRRRELINEKKLAAAPAEGENEFPKKRLLTFLDILLGHSLDVDESFTHESIREEVDTFMFAGHDTTAAAISWTCYLIALHPDVQKKVQEELDTELGEDKTKDISTEDLKKLKYLDCVVKECQRLCPSVPVIGRTVTEPFNLGKHVLPQGTSVEIFLYELHRDPDVFANPEVFNPDRFLPENSASRHPFGFLPFSAGSRNCIGQRLASMEVKITVASIFRSFNAQSLHHRDQLLLSIEIILRPVGGLNLKFTPREN